MNVIDLFPRTETLASLADFPSGGVFMVGRSLAELDAIVRGAVDDDQVRLKRLQPTHVMHGDNGMVYARYDGEMGPAPQLGVGGVVAIDWDARTYTTESGRQGRW